MNNANHSRRVERAAAEALPSARLDAVSPNQTKVIRTKTNLLKVKHIPTPGTNSAPNCTMFGPFMLPNPCKQRTFDRNCTLGSRPENWVMAKAERLPGTLDFGLSTLRSNSLT